MPDGSRTAGPRQGGYFTQVPGLQSAVDQDRLRRDQDLAERGAGDAAADAVRIECKCRDCFECRCLRLMYRLVTVDVLSR